MSHWKVRHLSYMEITKFDKFCQNALVIHVKVLNHKVLQPSKMNVRELVYQKQRPAGTVTLPAKLFIHCLFI